MAARILTAVFLVLLSASIVGCGCSETDLAADTGDTEIDQDDPVWDSEPYFDVLNPEADDFGPPYVDDPTWEPPVDGMSDPGWSDSTAPWCNPTGVHSHSLDVWSDPLAIYVSMSIPRGPHSQEFVYRNDGTGWIQYSEAGGDGSMRAVRKIVGVPGTGHLFGYGNRLLADITDSGIYWEDFTAVDVSVVNDSLAYALRGEGLPDPPILRWNGSTWGPLPGDPLPYQATAIWADDTSLFCAGEGGLVVSYNDESWYIHDTGTTHDFHEIWGFSDSDIWAAAHAYEGGSYVYHYNGETWQSVEPPRIPEEWRNECNHDGISEFWGVDGTLFYTGASGFGMWNGTSFEAIGFWPSEYVEGGYCTGGMEARGIWGNAVDEVFLAMSGSTETAPGCGYEFILWWDGSHFHWI